MQDVPPETAGHPDQLRWNARYAGVPGEFTAHRLASRALSLPLPDGPVLDLACGQSGSALLAAAAGRRVTAVDISDVALDRLGAEAQRRGVGGLITLVHADLGEWRPPDHYALVLCTGFWDRSAFGAATGAVAPDGLLAWEAFTAEARRVRPSLPLEWCLRPGEPASLLPSDITVLDQQDVPDARHGTKRRLLARRRGGTAQPSNAATVRLTGREA